jgi:hypothetical protein
LVVLQLLCPLHALIPIQCPVAVASVSPDLISLDPLVAAGKCHGREQCGGSGG